MFVHCGWDWFPQRYKKFLKPVAGGGFFVLEGGGGVEGGGVGVGPLGEEVGVGADVVDDVEELLLVDFEVSQ